MIRRDVMGRAAPAAWALVSRIAGLLASTAVAMILSRSLGPGEFGRFAVASSIAVGGSMCVTGGLNRAALRDIAARLAHDERGAARAVIVDSARALVIVGPVGVLVTALVGWPLLGLGRTLLLTCALAFALGVLMITSDLLRPLGEYRMANAAAGPSGGALVAFGFVVLAGWSQTRPQTADGALLLNLAAASVVAVAALTVFVLRARERTDAVGGRAARLPPRPLLVAGLPFMLTQVSMFLGGQIDLWVAGGTLSEDDTGLYAAALRVMNVIRIPLAAAQLTLLATIPALVALGRMKELEARVRHAATLAMLPATLALLPCILLAGPLLAVAFGEEYRGAAPLLVVLSLGQLVNVATGLCGTVLNLGGYERLTLIYSIVALAVSATADHLAAVVFGVEALAVVSAATTAGSFVGLWWLAHKRLDVWTHPFWPSRSRLRRMSASGAEPGRTGSAQRAQ